MLITISTNGTERDIAVAVQKSGFAWALDRDSADIVWFRVSLVFFILFYLAIARRNFLALPMN